MSGVKQFKEKARERYITDEEYQAVYEVSPDVVRVAMEIAYLCVARQSDVLSLQKDQLFDSGSTFVREKPALSKSKPGRLVCRKR